MLFGPNVKQMNKGMDGLSSILVGSVMRFGLKWMFEK